MNFRIGRASFLAQNSPRRESPEGVAFASLLLLCPIGMAAFQWPVVARLFRFMLVIKVEFVRKKKGRRQSLNAAAQKPSVSRLKKINAHVLVCVHKTCRRQGGKAALKALKRAIREQDLRGSVLVTKVKCLDQCGRGPVMVVYPDGVWYGGVNDKSARAIVSEHLFAGHISADVQVLRDLRDGEQPAK